MKMGPALQVEWGWCFESRNQWIEPGGADIGGSKDVKLVSECLDGSGSYVCRCEIATGSFGCYTCNMSGHFLV